MEGREQMPVWRSPLRHEGEEPDFLAYLFDTHLLSGEDGAEIDFLPI
jgi:hypothetical protein